MLTLFAIPKPFRGQSDLIQRNAIASWTRIAPRPEVLLFGDEEGTAEFAQELGVRHVPEVARNEFGTPRLDDLFARAERIATTPLLAYVNADIILSDEFPAAVARVQAALSRFLMVGQRWDLEVDAPLDFSAPDWQRTLADRARRANALQPPTCIDYFAFTRGFAEGLPPLAIGRTRLGQLSDLARLFAGVLRSWMPPASSPSSTRSTTIRIIREERAPCGPAPRRSETAK